MFRTYFFCAAESSSLLLVACEFPIDRHDMSHTQKNEYGLHFFFLLTAWLVCFWNEITHKRAGSSSSSGYFSRATLRSQIFNNYVWPQKLSWPAAADRDEKTWKNASNFLSIFPMMIRFCFFFVCETAAESWASHTTFERRRSISKLAVEWMLLRCFRLMKFSKPQRVDSSNSRNQPARTQCTACEPILIVLNFIFHANGAGDGDEKCFGTLSLCLAQRHISRECLIRFNWNIPYLVRNKLWIPLASLSSLCIGTTPTRCLGAMGIWHSLLFHTAQTTAHRELLGMNGKLTKEKPARRTRRHRDWGDEEEMLKGNNTQKK